MKIPLLLKRVLLVVLLLSVSVGCYVPTNRPVKGSRTSFPASRKDFVPGRTTRAEVLLIMGTPDNWSSDDETVLIYTWSEEKGVIVVPPSGCVPTPHIFPTFIETTSYIFTFDENGVLIKLDITFDRNIE